MTEEDTFDKLKRVDFDQVVSAMIVEDIPKYREWFIYDVATDTRITPHQEYWQKVAYGWTWEEFVIECKKRNDQNPTE